LETAEQIDAAAIRRRRRRRRTTPTPARMRFEAIHAEIRERVCLLHYPPGHTLSEAELAREFGISRTPIRRVLQRLEYEGLVESRHGIGTIVTLVDRQALTEIDSLRMKLAEISGEMTLLPLEDGIGRLERLFDRCGELRTRVDLDEFGRINIAVQQEVSRSIGNVPLREVSDRLFFQTSRMWLQLLPRMDWAEEVAAFSSEITDLLQAAVLNDLPSLHFARRNHISMNQARMKGYFAK
jgi:DNA-binding GntR family transcriptional regulator